MTTTIHATQPATGVNLRLDRQGLLRLDDPAGVCIRCEQGTLWVTVDNDPRDIILLPGESFAAPANRHTLVYALESAVLSAASATPACTAPRAVRHATQPASARWAGTAVPA